MTPSKEYPGFSEKEVEMFIALGFGDKIKLFVGEDDHMIMYKLAVEKCFLENKSGVAVDSLRRCVIALKSGTVYRLTQEWDDLIELNSIVELNSIWINRETKERWIVNLKHHNNQIIFLRKASDFKISCEVSKTGLLRDYIRE